ncbi:hypothetical protein [Bradyrhizobium guangzhouense]|uniref:DUF87 domain-containing protein n=1 Tax=Bradyrhizobium guangzhouense TaxID=1325095 RepID=A0AAE5X6H8_9BRAD|nr:hypothetical protein [Bradyrhizobium guangzhouense]QAU49663.1 hypothetical protein XH91_32730 [Bradyrhizobium guangzhouense]
MTPHITDHQLPGRDGVRVLVRLDITPAEHVLIFKYRMGADAIDFSVFYQGRKLTFGDFYGGTHSTIWDLDSPHQARAFVDGLRKGFAQFEQFLASNRKPVQQPEPPKPTWDFFNTDARFTSTWIVGKPEWGKTTLMSALIQRDLERVKEGKASLIVIDSQHEELGKHLPRLPWFAPGQPLHEKLIYLEPDLEHPLALNFLNFKGYHKLSKNEQATRRAAIIEMLNFFMGATTSDPSGFMKTIIGYCVRALALYPEPTIMDFKDLLVEGRLANLMKKDEYKHLKDQLDDETKRFLLTDLFKSYGQSLSSVATRINAIGGDDWMKAFFSNKENRFDLYDILREPHVIVINTREHRLQSKEVLGLFGRYFIALLMGVVRTRTGGGLPCYVHIDEAWQYIADEPIVQDLIATARRQKIAITFAQQQPSQISNTAVRKALQTCGVQISAGRQKHYWNVMVRGENHEIKAPHIDFSKIDGMPDPEWEIILQRMYDNYCVPTKKPTGPPPEMEDAV